MQPVSQLAGESSRAHVWDGRASSRRGGRAATVDTGAPAGKGPSASIVYRAGRVSFVGRTVSGWRYATIWHDRDDAESLASGRRPAASTKRPRPAVVAALQFRRHL